MVRFTVGFGLAAAAALSLQASPASAQRAEENATRAAGDAFGTNIGNERVGLYTPSDVRGFSPTSAGNLRLDGIYFDMRLPPPPRQPAGNQVRVGLTAQSYPFPAPTGIVDYSLRPVGNRSRASTIVQVGPNDAYNVEVEGAVVFGPKFGVVANIGQRRDEELPGDPSSSWGASITPLWRPRDGVEIRPFYAMNNRPDKLAAAQVFVAGARLPAVPEARSYAPQWTETLLEGHVWGAVGRVQLTRQWTFRGGYQHYEIDDDGTTSDSYLNTDANGVAATRRFAELAGLYNDSDSGEARLSGVFAGKNFEHVVHLSLRGRSVARTFGGVALVNQSNVAIGQFNAPAVAPNWVYGPQSLDKVKQWSAGVSYQIARRDLGLIGLGVQQVDYQKIIESPGRPVQETTDKPVFWNGQAAWTPSRRLALYAAFTRGLEEAPIAPDVAVNAQETPPAIRTKQWEAGVRWVIATNLRLVVGWFDIQKPYFNLDATRVWRDLGVERHSGIESSLTGEVLPGLNLVAGYVHMEPVVTGEAVDRGLIGEVPLGQPEDTARISFDYRPTPTFPLSVDGAFNYFGARPISARTFVELGGKQLEAPGYSTIDLGMRYRLATAGRRSTVRAQLLNVADARKWVAGTNGGLTILPPRRFLISLTTDF